MGFILIPVAPRLSLLLVLKSFLSGRHLSLYSLLCVANSACWPWGLIFGWQCIFKNSLKLRDCNLWLWFASGRSEILFLHENAGIYLLQICQSKQNYLPLKHLLLVQGTSIWGYSIMGIYLSITHYSFCSSEKHFAILPCCCSNILSKNKKPWILVSVQSFIDDNIRQIHCPHFSSVSLSVKWTQY